MKNLQNFWLKIWNTPFYHGILMAAISAFIGVVYPFVTEWLTTVGTTDLFKVPELKMIAVSALKASVAGVIAYLAKNGMVGSSNTSASNEATLVKDVVDEAVKTKV